MNVRLTQESRITLKENLAERITAANLEFRMQKEWFIATTDRSEIFIGHEDPFLALSRWCAQEGVRRESVITLVDGIFGGNRIEEARVRFVLGPDAQEMFSAHFTNTEHVHFVDLSDRARAAVSEIEAMGLAVQDEPIHKNCVFFFRITRKGTRYSMSCPSKSRMSYRIIA